MFKDCIELEGFIYDGETVERKLLDSIEEIETLAFENCYDEEFVDFVVSDNVHTIGEAVFRGTTNLATLTLPFVGEHNGTAEAETLKNEMFGWVYGYIEGDITDNKNY